MPILSSAMKTRLQNEYKELQKVPKNSLYDWTIAPGETAPYVRSYIVTYHIKTRIMNGAKLGWQDETAIRISKEALNEPWKAEVVRGSVPYHPNWWPRGNVCQGNGMDDPGMWLYEAINFVGKLLQFQPDVINPNSPANGDANSYWLSHKNDRDAQGQKMFPTDTRVFPLPKSRPKIVIKKFTPNS